MISYRPILASERDDAIDVLTVAFHGYPFLERTLANGTATTEELRREMFGIAIDARLQGLQQAYVAEEDGKVLAVATLSSSGEEEWPDELMARWTALEAKCSEDGKTHFQTYTELQSQIFDDAPHVYVIALGVRPELQGQGLGRNLLARVNPDNLPLRLDTHDPANVEKYLRMGFRLVSEADLRGMPNWFFER